MSELTVRRFSGADIAPYIPDLARLRIGVFRAFPYLYDGDFGYEEEYLSTYSRSSESLFVLVFDRERVVGAATAIPMADETDEFKRPFVAQNFDPDRIFYFGESVLAAAYRGQGLGVRFFAEREAYARSLNRFTHTAFCAVDRPATHHRRPADYVPLDRFWNKRGYRKHPELWTTYAWKDLDEAQASEKRMTFWLRRLDDE